MKSSISALIYRNKKLFSNSAVYLFTNILNAALPFFLLPILTTYLNPEEFGMLGIFQGLYTAFLALVGLGIGGAIVRMSYDLDERSTGEYIFNCILIMLISLISLVLISSLLYPWVQSFLQISLSWVLGCLLLSAALFLINTLLGQLQVRQKPTTYGLIQVGHSGLNLILSLLFVIALSWNAGGRILGMILASLIFAILGTVTLSKMGLLVPKLNKTYLKDALSFGLPLVPHELGTFFITWFSMFVINQKLDTASVGVYLFAFQLSMVLGVCADAFNKAYVPWLFSQLNSQDTRKKSSVVKLTYIYFIAMILITLFSFWLGPWVITLLFSSQYATAGSVFGWLVAGQAFAGMYLMVTNYILYSKKTSLLSSITFLSSVLAIVLSFSLIPTWGITGAAISFALTRFIMFLLTWLGASRVVSMPWTSISFK